VGRDRSPALRHPVDLAFLHIEPGQEERVAQNLGGEQGPLPPDAGEENIALRERSWLSLQDRLELAQRRALVAPVAQQRG